MSDLRTAAQQALEFIRSMNEHGWLLADYESDMERTVAGLEAALAQEPTTCAWHGDEEGAYETSCKHIFQMIDGTPQENDFTHCCFCGKALAQHSWEDGNDE